MEVRRCAMLKETDLSHRTIGLVFEEEAGRRFNNTLPIQRDELFLHSGRPSMLMGISLDKLLERRPALGIVDGMNREPPPLPSPQGGGRNEGLDHTDADVVAVTGRDEGWSERRDRARFPAVGPKAANSGHRLADGSFEVAYPPPGRDQVADAIQEEQIRIRGIPDRFSEWAAHGPCTGSGLRGGRPEDLVGQRLQLDAHALSRTAGSQLAAQVIQSGDVAFEAQPGNHTLRRRRCHHAVSFGLAGEDIRDVDFDDRLTRAAQSIGEGQAVMRQRSRIDDDRVAAGALLLDRIDQLTLVVRLQAVQLDAVVTRACREHRLQVRQCPSAINLGFASSKGAEVGAVEDQHPQMPSTSDNAVETTDASTAWP